MSFPQRVINLSVAEDKIVTTDTETGKPTVRAGIQGENNAALLHFDVPQEWLGLTVNLYIIAENGVQDMATAVDGVIDMPIQGGLTANSGQLKIHLEVVDGANVRKTLDTTLNVQSSATGTSIVTPISPTILQNFQQQLNQSGGDMFKYVYAAGKGIDNIYTVDHALAADEATHADSANTADNATHADEASHAVVADEASHAVVASGAKNGPILVDNYGAKGDGQTDDTAAIQAALNAAYEAGGGTVLFKPGKIYLISQALYVRDNTTIVAYGATIRNITDGGELLVNQLHEETISGYNGHSYIAIYGGIWDCNAYNGHDGVNIVGNDGMAFTHARVIILCDLQIRDTANFHALEFNAVQQAIVRNCAFLGWSNTQNNPNYTTKEAIQIDAALEDSGLPAYDGTLCDDILIDGCRFYSSGRCGAPPRGIGSHTTYNNNYNNIRIVNNKFHDLSSYAIAPWYWNACIIANNNFWGCGGVYGENNLNNSIINNNVIVSPADAGISLQQSNNNLVCNNKIEYATNNGIALAGSNGNAIISNYIKGVTNDYGIVLGPLAQTDEGNKISSTNNYVFGNFIRDAGKAGIRLSANATGNTISSNKCKSITFDASATGCLVINNDLTGYGQTLAQAIVTNGANPQVANNYV